MKKTKLIAATMTALLLVSCAKTPATEPTTTVAETTAAAAETTTEVTEETEASETTAYTPVPDLTVEALEALDGVTRVEDLSVVRQEGYNYQNADKSNFVVYFEQPLDWNDPSKGTFEQRITIAFNGAKNSEFYVGGYFLNDNILTGQKYFDTYAVSHVINYISAEYRFFGKSRPEDLDNNSPKYWEYLTSYNAACDFHHIITELKKVMPGSWMMAGASKGGVATMVQAMYFPDDANVFVPQIAPVMSSPQEEIFVKNIYETIGDDRYGPEQAAEYRQLVLDFQVEAIKNRDALQDRVWEYLTKDSNEYTDMATPEIVFDHVVLSFAIRTWQYAQDFESIQNVLDLKGEDGYVDEIYYLLTGDKPADEETPPYVTEYDPVPYDYYPYYVQCMKELGYFKADFSYLRDALEKDGSGAKLVVTEDMEDMFNLKLFIQPEVLETLSFDISLHDDLVNWSQTTDANVIMLFGGSDVWYPLRLPDVPDRENFHTFVDDSDAHGRIYSHIDLYSRSDIQDLIDEAMKR